MNRREDLAASTGWLPGLSTTSTNWPIVNTLWDRTVTQARRCQTGHVDRRFLTLADVSEVLNVSASQAYALVRGGDLRAIKVGGRGQWRIEKSELDRFIAQRYEETEKFIAEHPFGNPEDVAID